MHATRRALLGSRLALSFEALALVTVFIRATSLFVPSKTLRVAGFDSVCCTDFGARGALLIKTSAFVAELFVTAYRALVIARAIALADQNSGFLTRLGTGGANPIQTLALQAELLLTTPFGCKL